MLKAIAGTDIKRVKITDQERSKNKLINKIITGEKLNTIVLFLDVLVIY